MLGPPLGGAAIGVFGPVVTVLANAVSYLLSALGIRAIAVAGVLMLATPVLLPWREKSRLLW
jgi:hypothetical protein